jgi:ribosome maturation factor RimP
MSDSAMIDRVRELVIPIADDLGLDLYDVERRGGTLRVTLDTRAGAERGITLDTLALATRLVSRELDHTDPVPGRYTLEVTSPGVERSLRTPEHFRREVGKTVAVRLHAVTNEERRLEGELVAADDSTITIRVADGPGSDTVVESDDGPERVIPLDQIDRARTVFEWGPQPKPGGRRNQKSGSKSHKRKETKPS